GEDRHAHVLLAKRAQGDIVSPVSVVSKVGAIPVEDAWCAVQIYEIADESIVPDRTGNGLKRIRQRSTGRIEAKSVQARQIGGGFVFDEQALRRTRPILQ